MSNKSQIKTNEKVDYLHPDGKQSTKPKSEEEKVNKAQAEESTELARKLVEDECADDECADDSAGCDIKKI